MGASVADLSEGRSCLRSPPPPLVVFLFYFNFFRTFFLFFVLHPFLVFSSRKKRANSWPPTSPPTVEVYSVTGQVLDFRTNLSASRPLTSHGYKTRFYSLEPPVSNEIYYFFSFIF